MSGLTASTSASSTGTRVALEGELDLATADRASAALDAALAAADSVVLDLRGLTFIDSSGLAVIMRAAIQARDRDQEFTVVPGPTTLRLFELTGLSPFIGIADGETSDPRAI